MKKYYKFEFLPEGDPIDVLKEHFKCYCIDNNLKTYKQVLSKKYQELCNNIIYCIAEMIHSDSEYTKIHFIEILCKYISSKQTKLVKDYLELYFFDYRAHYVYFGQRKLYKIKPQILVSVEDTKYTEFNFNSMHVYKLVPYIKRGKNAIFFEKGFKYEYGYTKVLYVKPKDSKVEYDKKIVLEEKQIISDTNQYLFNTVYTQYYGCIQSDKKEINGIIINDTIEFYFNLVDFMSNNDKEYEIFKTEEFYKKIKNK